MARPLRMESEDGVYHVLNRGNNRSDIFWTEGAGAAFEAGCGRHGHRPQLT